MLGFCDKLIITFQKGVTVMKIERLSENQIRCTLYKADLADKELLLTELAYGTDKAKELFRELMQQASSELGFEVDNVPLMIEAIPVSPECLILVITKVEDPEEFYQLLEIYNQFPMEELIIHPRVQKDFYKNQPRMEYFSMAVEESKNPVCYNGNIFSIINVEISFFSQCVINSNF